MVSKEHDVTKLVLKKPITFLCSFREYENIRVLCVVIFLLLPNY